MNDLTRAYKNAGYYCNTCKKVLFHVIKEGGHYGEPHHVLCFGCGEVYPANRLVLNMELSKEVGSK